MFARLARPLFRQSAKQPARGFRSGKAKKSGDHDDHHHVHRALSGENHDPKIIIAAITAVLGGGIAVVATAVNHSHKKGGFYKK